MIQVNKSIKQKKKKEKQIKIHDYSSSFSKD